MKFRKFYKMKINYILVFFLLLIFFSCKDDRDKLPNVAVDIYINILSDPNYSDLQTVGNSIPITGGIKGIFLYRKSQSEIQAYERACTFDPEGKCQRVIWENGNSSDIIVVDTICNSRFLMASDGIILEGSPAKMPLKQYNVVFNGEIVYISN
ncbi:MAG: hypothetical protein B6I24_01515 [Bacteroidetes bacterium 4572_128]|nr:MAG: hypothetical protein B6I24_01515 [Bacteroidetes bacterium 4572_128]